MQRTNVEPTVWSRWLNQCKSQESALCWPTYKLFLVTTLGLGLAPPSTSVRALHRFAVKGLERDELPSVLLSVNEGFPSDRRWALHFDDAKPFHATQPEWLHKSNFLCAFTATELLAGFVTTFDDDTATLRVWRRSAQQPGATGDELGDALLAARLDEEQGRAAASTFFSNCCGRGCSVVTAGAHQFGNTGSGLKASGDVRTVHLVNENTVAALSEACGVALHPDRFRPNLIVGGALPAWEEFSWVGREVRLGEVTLRVISRTVRCEGVNVDARHGSFKAYLDIPGLLATHFPEHGPYLGVYAQVVEGGRVRLGDAVESGGEGKEIVVKIW